MTRIISILFLVAAPFFANAKKLSAIEIYRRCKIHISSLPTVTNGQIENQIKTGKLNPVSACLDLLDQGQFDSDGRLKNNTIESRAVLRTLFNFHRTWFSANTIEQVQDYSEEVARGTGDHYDPNEPALTITRSLFGKNIAYREIASATTGVTALREENLKVKNKFGFTTSNPMRRINAEITSDRPVVSRNLGGEFINQAASRPATDFHQIPVVQVGDLVGIVPTSNSYFIPNLELRPVSADALNGAGDKQIDLNFNFDFFKHRGGGLIGSNIFFLMNNGHSLGLKTNGTTKLPRRWVKSAMESMLCSNFPSLRESDVRSLTLSNSKTPFRNGVSCVQCHATMDQAATTARNILIGSTDYSTLVMKDVNDVDVDFKGKMPLVVTDYKVSKPASATWLSEEVDDFHLQSPTGVLYFRSMNGQLVNRKVSNISELGVAFTETDDFYNCAAKRYFEYFTGVNVALYDRTNPANAVLNRNLSKEDILYRSFVEKLGEQLKATQSLRTIVESILKSDYYLNTPESKKGGA